MSTTVYDLVQSASFYLEFGELGKLFLTEISGIEEEMAVIEETHIIGGFKSIKRKRPGLYSIGTLTVKRAVDANTTLADWRQRVVDGSVADARLDGSIVAVDQEGKPIAEWTFMAAWPSKLNVSGFGTDSDGIVSEEATIVYEYLERTQ